MKFSKCLKQIVVSFISLRLAVSTIVDMLLVFSTSNMYLRTCLTSMLHSYALFAGFPSAGKAVFLPRTSFSGVAVHWEHPCNISGGFSAMDDLFFSSR